LYCVLKFKWYQVKSISCRYLGYQLLVPVDMFQLIDNLQRKFSNGYNHAPTGCFWMLLFDWIIFSVLVFLFLQKKRNISILKSFFFFYHSWMERVKPIFLALFQQLYFYGSIMTLFIQRCFNIGITQMPGHWSTNNGNLDCLWCYQATVQTLSWDIKVALSLLLRIYSNFAKRCISPCLS